MITVPSVRSVMLDLRTGEQTPLASLTVSQLRAIRTARDCSAELRGACAEELRRREDNAALNVMRADHELREEVITALMDEGKAGAVALELVNTQVKLLAQAKRLEII